MKNERIVSLIIGRMEGRLVEAEERELEVWMGEAEVNRQVAMEFLDEEALKVGLRNALSRDNVWERVTGGMYNVYTNTANLTNAANLTNTVDLINTANLTNITNDINSANAGAAVDTGKVRKMGVVKRIAGVAAIVVLFMGGYWVWKSGVNNNDVVKVGKSGKGSDVVPGGNKAVLTLANGRTIVLDDVANGNLAQQGSVRVMKLDNGRVAYNVAGGGADKGMLYNTISTPRGGQYQIILPDGSRVWLNAASSVRFPTVFGGGEREVEVKGEAYFEVMQNSRQVFVVHSGELKVEVLGTSFNINAYTNERGVRTTLVDGAVRVSGYNEEQVLKPGEQVHLVNKHLTLVSDIDVLKVVAWKEGLFNFDGVSVEELMRQVERWYDVEVLYEGGVPNKEFVGKIRRNISFSDLLKSLADVGVHFRLDGRRLIVMP